MTEENVSLGILYILLMSVPYFIPWFVASSRGHHNITVIGITNLLLGGTLLGWVVALIWAFTNPRPATK